MPEVPDWVASALSRRLSGDFPLCPHAVQVYWSEQYDRWIVETVWRQDARRIELGARVPTRQESIEDIVARACAAVGLNALSFIDFIRAMDGEYD